MSHIPMSTIALPDTIFENGNGGPFKTYWTERNVYLVSLGLDQYMSVKNQKKTILVFKTEEKPWERIRIGDWVGVQQEQAITDHPNLLVYKCLVLGVSYFENFDYLAQEVRIQDIDEFSSRVDDLHDYIRGRLHIYEDTPLIAVEVDYLCYSFMF